MSMKLLGTSFDLHLGGEDLPFLIMRMRSPKAKALQCRKMAGHTSNTGFTARIWWLRVKR